MSGKSRREFMQLAGTTVAVGSLISLPSPASIPGVDVAPTNASPFLAANFGGFGLDPEDQLIEYSGEHIAVHLPYSEGEKASLVEWIDSSDDRELIQENDAINSLTVKLPASEVGGQILSNPVLDDLGYLDDDRLIDANAEMARPEPVELEERPDELLSFGPLRSAVLGLHGWSDISAGDVAYNDAEAGTVRDAARATDASDTFVSNTSTSTITVAVIDTGFNTAGGEILGDTTRILDASTDFTNSDKPTVGSDGLDAVADGEGHGTHVASTIAADPSSQPSYRGYLPDADLLILKALGDDGGGSTADIARAVTYAADENADVLCMSLGSPIWSAELERALEYAVDEGTIPVVAAGNNRESPQPFVNSPADSDHALAVAAGEVRENDVTRGGSFSAVGPDPGTVNFSDGKTNGASPDIAAPGVKLTALTANTTGSTSETTLSGTSMAAPCVAGGVGLLLAASSVEQTLSAVTDRLTEYAAPAPKLGTNEGGAGWLAVEPAVNETTTDEDTADRNDKAEARDASWDALSDGYGGQLASLFL